MDVSEIIGKDEEVLEVVRKHWISVAPLMLAFSVLSLAALVGVYALGRYGADIDRVSKGADALGLGALMALGLLLAYSAWWVYRENLLILTNRNLYMVTQNSLFSRTTKQFGLERLQDVSAQQRGLLPTLLGYGDLTVETAGEEENPAFKMVADPSKLAARVMECHKQAIADSDAKQSTDQV